MQILDLRTPLIVELINVTFAWPRSLYLYGKAVVDLTPLPANMIKTITEGLYMNERDFLPFVRIRPHPNDGLYTGICDSA